MLYRDRQNRVDVGVHVRHRFRIVAIDHQRTALEPKRGSVQFTTMRDPFGPLPLVLHEAQGALSFPTKGDAGDGQEQEEMALHRGSRRK